MSEEAEDFMSDDVRRMAEAIFGFEQRIISNPIITAEESLLSSRVNLDHVAWKFDDLMNEIWIDGILSMVFKALETTEKGGKDRTNVEYKLQKKLAESDTKEYIIEKSLFETEKLHLAWLTDPNVHIDSATIDMEFDSRLMINERKFKIKHLNISVSSNYETIEGWLSHMDEHMDSFILRQTAILDPTKLLLHPFAHQLKKLMIVYESSFDDETIIMLNATHIQISSDFVTENGINLLLHRWDKEDFPIQSSMIVYMIVKNRNALVKGLKVINFVHHQDHDTAEILVQLKNPQKRLRVVTRVSSVVCTIFAVTNSIGSA